MSETLLTNPVSRAEVRRNVMHRKPLRILMAEARGDDEFVQALGDASEAKLVMVLCNPAVLADK